MRVFLYRRDFYGNPQLMIVVDETEDDALRRIDEQLRPENYRAFDEKGKAIIKLLEVDTSQRSFQIVPTPMGNPNFR